jgi:epoxyqueuosine reductase
MSLRDDIKHKALELGFDLVGVTDASSIDVEQVELLAAWLKSGYAGRMNYMQKNFEKRINPAKLLENAQSVIAAALNYTPPKRRSSLPQTKQSHLRDTIVPMGKIANYTQYEDYHSFMKKRLHKLTEFITSIAEADYKFKICVDSTPLAERALAARAGLGFIGKNHMLINPKLGLQIFLGEIITDLKLQADKPIFGHSQSASVDEESIQSITAKCANCDKCGQFDANKCISYLTIEYKSQIPSELAEKIGDRLFGCDECVLACPWQRNAPVCKNKQFKFYNDRAELDLRRILNFTQRDFDAEFDDSPIKRLGLERLKRNAQVCLNNAGSKNQT